ncbi:hypothetical protein C8Q79DRAFT_56601 [Trametes meyenii]|nr:hypothetical protein C8Q79DRAFT_56601 [Trametes meyenii]
MTGPTYLSISLGICSHQRDRPRLGLRRTRSCLRRYLCCRSATRSPRQSDTLRDRAGGMQGRAACAPEASHLGSDPRSRPCLYEEGGHPFLGECGKARVCQRPGCLEPAFPGADGILHFASCPWSCATSSPRVCMIAPRTGSRRDVADTTSEKPRVCSINLLLPHLPACPSLAQPFWLRNSPYFRRCSLLAVSLFTSCLVDLVSSKQEHPERSESALCSAAIPRWPAPGHDLAAPAGLKFHSARLAGTAHLHHLPHAWVGSPRS